MRLHAARGSPPSRNRAPPPRADRRHGEQLRRLSGKRRARESLAGCRHRRRGRRGRPRPPHRRALDPHAWRARSQRRLETRVAWAWCSLPGRVRSSGACGEAMRTAVAGTLFSVASSPSYVRTPAAFPARHPFGWSGALPPVARPLKRVAGPLARVAKRLMRVAGSTRASGGTTHASGGFTHASGATPTWQWILHAAHGMPGHLGARYIQRPNIHLCRMAVMTAWRAPR